ncbi:MAG: Ig-like domain-containing protein [Candidatus Cyclobacteriaceae bacterium M3_2C_046]
MLFTHPDFAQAIKAYDDYAAIEDDKEEKIEVLKNDIYKKDVSLSIISYSTQGDPAKPPEVKGNKIRVKYDDEATLEIKYQICSKADPDQCSQAILYLTISDEDLKAARDIYTLTKPGKYNLDVLANDLYEKGKLGLRITKAATYGKIIVKNKKISYQVDNLDFDEDSFEYEVSNEDGNDRAIVTIYNLSENSPPLVADFSLSTREDQRISFEESIFSAHYSDPDQDPLNKIIIKTIPSRGNLTLNNQKINAGTEIPADQLNEMEYVPDQDYFGEDGFTWNASDAEVYARRDANLLIQIDQVNDPPTAKNDTFALKEDQELMLDVLQNDSDPENDPLTITRIYNLETGQAEVRQEQIWYTPPPDYSGSVKFKYQVTDQDKQTEALVFLTITPVNDPPTAENDTFTLAEDQELMLNVLQNDSDPENDPLTITRIFNLETGQAEVRQEQIWYAPPPNFAGSVKFDYQVTDQKNQDEAEVFLTITPSNDPPQVNNITISLKEDENYQLNPSQFKENYVDHDDQPLKEIKFNVLPRHGILTLNDQNLVKDQIIELENLTNLVYQPDQHFNGTDSASWQGLNQAEQSGPAKIIFQVQPVNDLPIAENDTFEMKQGQTSEIKVLENDYDPDGDPLILTGTDEPEFGGVEIEGDVLIYSSSPEYAGTVQFTYQVSDEQAQAEGVLLIKIAPEENLPQTTNITIEMAEDQSYSFDHQTFNDHYTDPAQQVIRHIIFSYLPGQGQIKLNDQEIDQGQAIDWDQVPHLSYHPRQNYFGRDSARWLVKNKYGLSDTSDLILNINPVNDVPVAISDTFEIVPGESLSMDVLKNDQDPDNDQLSLLQISTPAYGEAAISQNKIIYRSEPAFSGSLSFEYTITDQEAEAKAEIYLIIDSVKQASPDRLVLSLDEDQSYTFKPEEILDLIDQEKPESINFTELPQTGSILLNGSSIAAQQKYAWGQVKNLIYQPAPNVNGKDSAEWLLQSTDLNNVAQTILFQIKPVNDPPVALLDSGLVILEDDTIMLDLLDNDYDIDSDTFYLYSARAEQGSVKIMEDQGLQFIPPSDYCGQITLTYQIADPEQAIGQGKAWIQVRCRDDAPLVSDIQIRVDQSESFYFNASLFRLATVDPEQDTLQQILVLNQPEKGQLSVNLNPLADSSILSTEQLETLQFDPAPDWSGQDHFTWKGITNGLISSNQAQVKITVLPGEPQLVIYQGFSPNGDQYNEQWIIDGIEQFPDNEVMIFNRNNILVFKQKNYDNREKVWQGQTNVHHFNPDHSAPNDVYYYLIRLKKSNQVYKGDVTLKR